MTTIVWDGQTMYADSLLTDEYGMKLGSVPKIFKGVVGGWPTIAAVCGDYKDACTAKDWYLCGAYPEGKPEFSEDADFEVVAASEQGVVFFGPELRPTPAPSPYYCGGSGAAYALAALTLGHDGVKAIETAALLDSSTGGEVQSMSLEQISEGI